MVCLVHVNISQSSLRYVFDFVPEIISNYKKNFISMSVIRNGRKKRESLKLI